MRIIFGGWVVICAALFWFEPPVDIFVTNEEAQAIRWREEADRLEALAKKTRAESERLMKQVREDDEKATKKARKIKRVTIEYSDGSSEVKP